VPDLPAIVLRVSELGRSVAFYRDALGFTLAEHRPADDVAVIVDKDGDAMLLAGPRATDLAPFARPDPWLIKPSEALSYAADDLDAVRARLAAHGVTSMRPASMPWGDPALDITDPDGYLLRYVLMLNRTPEQALALLNQGPDALDEALAGLSASDMDLARAPGEWTIRQIIGHLVDGDTLILLPTVKMALAESGRTRVASRWNQDQWAGALYATLEVAPSLALIRATRAYLTALLATHPDPWERFVLIALERTGGGSTEGPGRKRTVYEEVLTMATHTFEHVDEIRQTRAAHGR
jgi:catechol 2,3-dioxygenase-like lactoylglutathione lyase family enzyme